MSILQDNARCIQYQTDMKNLIVAFRSFAKASKMFRKPIIKTSYIFNLHAVNTNNLSSIVSKLGRQNLTGICMIF